RARHVPEAGRVERERNPELLHRLPDRRERRIVEGPITMRIRTTESAPETELRGGAPDLHRRRVRILEGKRSDADQPTRVGGAELGHPVVVDATRGDRE